jgi:hypothetical protein
MCAGKGVCAEPVHQADLLTNVGDVIEELPTAIRACRTRVAALDGAQRNLLTDRLSATEKKIY